MASRLVTRVLLILMAGLACTLSASPVLAQPNQTPDDPYVFTGPERQRLESLWIGRLPEVPDDPSNAYDTDPRAARFGKMLFHAREVSANGQIACATCHPRETLLTDDNPLAMGMGTTDRRAMPLAGVVYSPWLFWDGRKDSLWSQALGPIESPVEHGITRTRTVQVVYGKYREEYESLFGPLPPLEDVDGPAYAGPLSAFNLGRQAWGGLPEAKRNTINRIYSNVGKAIAAYVRLIVPGESRFDRFVDALRLGRVDEARKILTPREVAGLRLFTGKASCINCHFGPRFTNDDFHNLFIPPKPELRSDHGRAVGIKQVKADEFNCLGPYSDASGQEDCADLVYMDTDVAKYSQAFKTPSLRNVTERRFYMHAGQFETLDQVFAHYRTVGNQIPELGHFGFIDQEVEALKAFLATLEGPIRILAPFDEVIEGEGKPYEWEHQIVNTSSQ